MPIYAYRCDTCGHAKDVLQKVSDPVLTDCPACGAATFRKQITAAGFQLKGSGWYVTDFKGSGAKPAADKAADKPAADAKPADGAAAASSDAPAASASSPAPAPAPAPAAGGGSSSGSGGPDKPAAKPAASGAGG